MTDVEKHLIHAMSPPDRCAVWMMAAMRMQEIAELMSKEDIKTLKMMLDIIKEEKRNG